MINLTFGEQVKIVLSRKGMTIKDLAEQIEKRTGKKMSRQNLTQRLGRDNFQEQDMRMIANILGCSFQLSILASAEAAEKAAVVEEVPPTGIELQKLLAKQKLKMDREHAKKQAERDLTMGEFVDMMENPVEGLDVPEVEEEQTAEENVAVELPEKVIAPEEIGNENNAAEEAAAKETQAEEMVAEENPAEEMAGVEGAPEETGGQSPEEEFAAEAGKAVVESPAENQKEPEPEPAPESPKRESTFGKIAKMISSPKKEEPRYTAKHKDFQPIKRRADEEEDRERGDVNPYTGHEYQSNSVRMHPKRIGYVQVYDRKEHKWTDMTEWAFLGVEERKKAMLGKDYEPPIYLD